MGASERRIEIEAHFVHTVRHSKPTADLRRKRQMFEICLWSMQMASVATPCRVSSVVVGVGCSGIEGKGISELLSHMTFSFPEPRKMMESLLSMLLRGCPGSYPIT